MAITIITYPNLQGTTTDNKIMPVNNPIVFTVNSTNVALCNFKYICDVYVNGTFIKRLDTFPASVTGYGVFKVQRILEDYVSFDLHPNLYGSYLFAKNENSIIYYTLKFGEEYDVSAQCDAGTIVYPNLTLSTSVTGSDFMAFNGTLQKKQWLEYYYGTYTATVVTSKFLTGFPDQALIQIGDQMTFNIFNNNLLKLRVKTYTSAGVLIGTYTYTNPYTSLTNNEDFLITIGVGPENLNNTTLLTGTQPVITSTVSYYTVQCLGSFDGETSELKRIDIDTRVNKWNPHRLWWLGQLGNFDSYTFTLKDFNTTDISRTEFTKIHGALASLSPGTEWSYEMSDRGRKTLSVNGQDKYVYNSNWLTETEALWMKELFLAVECYVSTTNPKICFYSITFNGDPINPQATLNFIDEVDLVAGDVIRLDIQTVGYELFNVEFEVLSVSANLLSVTITDPTLTAATTVYESGYYMLADFVTELLPVIIKSTSWEEKTKNKIRNIQYNIDLDDSHAVNTQRN